MKRMLGILSLATACLPVCAQYLPNRTFKDWKKTCGSTYQTSTGGSGRKPVGLIVRPGIEPADWNGSNVKQKVIFEGKSEQLVTKGDVTATAATSSLARSCSA